MLLVYGIILGIIGLIMLIKPHAIWSITEKWKSYNATESSNLYIYSIRFGGIMCTIVSIICFYGYFFI